MFYAPLYDDDDGELEDLFDESLSNQENGGSANVDTKWTSLHSASLPHSTSMYYVAPYPTEHRLRSAIIFIFFFEILGCIYQFVAHIWAAAIINVIIAIVVAFIGLTAAYRKSEGGLLFYSILQMISVVLQLANGVWIILEVFFLAGRCESGWHCHGWHHARGWPFAIFVLSVISTLLYLFLKIYAAALALRLRDQVHSAHIAEAFVAPRPNEAAYQSSYQASQPSYLAPPRSPVVARPDVTTYGTSTA